MSPLLSAPLIDTLRRVLPTFERLGLRFALMGGIAAAAWGRIRATQDIDLLVMLGGTSTDALLAALRQSGLTFRRSPPITAVSGTRFLQTTYSHPDHYVDIEIDFALADSDFHALAVQRAVPFQFDGLTIPVVTAEDLILLKLAAGRVIDRVDTAELYHAHHAQLDLSYLRRAAASLGCEPALDDLLAGRLGP